MDAKVVPISESQRSVNIKKIAGSATTPLMKTNASQRHAGWTQLPDAITEEEVRLKLTWLADTRTRRAIVRQAKVMGFETPTAYLIQALAATIASNEEDTYVNAEGHLASGCEIDRP
jgi:hypothetical protein